MGNNSFSSKKTVERIREQYPEGCRVELINMEHDNDHPCKKAVVIY